MNRYFFHGGRLLGLLFLWLFMASLGIAAERLPIPGIKGSDDRVLVTTLEYPWSAIGRVNNTLGGFCTGTLVGPRRVLTAAHCLWNFRTRRWLPTCALHFLAGYQRGQYLKHSLVASYQLPDVTDSDRPPRLYQDWAILVLAEDLGKIATSLPTAPLDPGQIKDYQQQQGIFSQAGYSRDRPHILTRHNACQLTGFKSKNRLVLHRCDATFGDSGSPILLMLEDRYYIVGIHVAINDKLQIGVAVAGSTFHDGLENLDPPLPMTDEIKACKLRDRSLNGDIAHAGLMAIPGVLNKHSD